MYIADNAELMTNGEINKEKLAELAEQVMVINPGMDVFLLDEDGYVVAQTASANTIESKQVSLEPILRFINSVDETSDYSAAERISLFEPKFPLFGDNPRGTGTKTVFSAHPFNVGGKTVGYVYAVLSGPMHRSLFESMTVSYSVRTATIVTLSVLLLVVLGGACIFFILTKRLRKLSLRISQWQHYYSNLEVDANHLHDKSDNSEAIPNVAREVDLLSIGGSPTRDEIGQLAASYEEMMSRLLEQNLSLKQADSNRRELFAAISHDLRTPLTSMEGYLETVNERHGVLEPTQKQRYLKIALRQSKRLRHLIDKVLELSSLHSGEFKIYPANFCTLELVYDCVQDFAIKAKQKRVVARVVPRQSFDHKLHAFADLALIHRVLENLLDNAIRFTQSGGEIIVDVRRIGDEKISIAVVDTGVGMSEDEAAHAFDSHFSRSDTVSSVDRGLHTGLGLAIVKAVVELHGENIVLHTKPGKGSAFKFTLPAANQ